MRWPRSEVVSMSCQVCARAAAVGHVPLFHLHPKGGCVRCESARLLGEPSTLHPCVNGPREEGDL